jgi:hypothetical protein
MRDATPICWGRKKVVIFGLFGCFLSGLSYLLAATNTQWAVLSMVLLCVDA